MVLRTRDRALDMGEGGRQKVRKEERERKQE
jgi:hypothetical protein